MLAGEGGDATGRPARQVADELTAATGAPVEYVDVPDDAALQGMVSAGVPEAVARQIVNIFVQSRQGVAEHVTSTVGDVTGRRARGITAFCREHHRAFAPAAELAR